MRTVEVSRGPREHRGAPSVEGTAEALRRLTASSFRVADLNTVSELLIRIADQARAVLAADEATVTVSFETTAIEAIAFPDTNTVCRHAIGPAHIDAARRSSPAWLVQPICALDGEPRGSLAVRIGRVVNEHDRAMLELLAQMAAHAIDTVDLLRSVQTSESRVRVIVDAAPVAIVESDLEGTAKWWNLGASELLGWEPSEQGTIGQWHSRLPDMGAAWALAAAGTKVVDHEIVDVEVDSGRRDLSVSIAPLRSPSGAVRGLLTLLTDVTDRRRLEFELRCAHEAEAVGRLAGNVAHDFNNLLTLLTGYTSMLRDQPGGGVTEQLLDGIETTTERATALTDRLLAMSREHAPRPTTVALGDALTSLAEVLPKILGPRVHLALEIDDSVGSAEIDPAQFEQIILNLSTNARDAMGGSGRLTLGAHHAPADRWPQGPRGLTEHGYVEITVGDDGAGMAEETARHCFDPYFSTKGAGRGTGLGLATVKLAVAEASGAIRLDSAPGEGTTFAVVLPAGPPPATSVAHGNGERVLVVENDEEIRALMVRTLKRNGYAVVDAPSGTTAIGAVGDEPLDLLVSDVELGAMSGFELADTLRSSALAVLFVSGTVRRLEPPWSHDRDASLLTKPFVPSALLNAVHAALRTSDRALV